MWQIIGHYTLGFGLAGAFVAVAIFSIALQAELNNIPLIGGWLADNIKHIREWAIIGAVLTASHIIVYSIGVRDERAHWKAAEQAAIKVGQNARAAAVRSIDRAPAPAGLRGDEYNRDNP